jgi:integrase
MSDKEIVPSRQTALGIAGQIANKHAAANAFKNYRQELTANSRRAQYGDLAVFEQFLKTIGIVVEGDETVISESQDEKAPIFAISPRIWQGITHGLIEAFRNWQLQQGYAIGTINRRLSTVKLYAALACKSGVIESNELILIKSVTGYSNKKARNIDETRESSGIPTRLLQEDRPNKKAENVSIPDADVKTLKTVHDMDKPQGRRDAVLFCLLLDHGLRASEVAGLKVGNIDLDKGLMRFYRQKVDKWQTHKLTADSLWALRAYMTHDAVIMLDSPLLRASKKNGELDHAGLTTRTITRIVQEAGKGIGKPNLSAHDCRHSWASRAAGAGSSPFALQEAGGWNSLAMPRRYVDEKAIANEDIKLIE